MKTYSAKPSEVVKKWILIDADGVVLGRSPRSWRTACAVRQDHVHPAHRLRDNVIIINAAKVKVTGNKLSDKLFYWHTGHPGGIKDISIGKVLGGKFPERAIVKAVERMVPRGPLGRQQMKNLRVFAGTEHPHAAQQPETLDVNPKNKRSA
jgi:large subunit ribosomal protein L13